MLAHLETLDERILAELREASAQARTTPKIDAGSARIARRRPAPLWAQPEEGGQRERLATPADRRARRRAIEIARLARPAPHPLRRPGPRDPPARGGVALGAEGAGPTRQAGSRRLRRRPPAARRGGSGSRPSRGARLAREAGVLGRRAAADRRRGGGRAAAGPHARRQRRGDLLPRGGPRARRRVRPASPGATRSPTRSAAGGGRRRRALIADAVFTYLRLDGERGRDRAALPRARPRDPLGRAPRRRAGSLRRAATGLAGAGGEPLWRARYPVFPPVHLRARRGASRARSERRRSTGHRSAAKRSRSSPARRRWRSRSACSRICEREGPFAPIFRDFRDPDQPIDWLGANAA